jgi:hypothetical protein
MRCAAALSVLLASAGWVPVRDEPEVAFAGRVRPEPVLVDAKVAGGWRAMRDRTTGVIAQLWGGREEVPGAMADGALAERAARSFVGRHLAELAPGATLDDLVTITNRVDGRVRTIAFEQRWRGMRVVGGYVQVMFARDRLFAVTSQALPQVTATLPAQRVRATGERVVLPLADDAGALAYHVADLRAGNDEDEYVAPDGKLLMRASRVRHATGTLRYDVGIRRPGGARMAYPAAAAEVTVDGDAQVTNGDGGLTWAGTASAQVVTGVAGPFVAVVHQAGAIATTTLTLAPDGTTTWSAPTDEHVDAQLSAFVHVSIGKQHARRIFPSLAAWLDTPLQVFINEVGACNARAAEDGLHFNRAEAGCENTARLADVVYHELGHALHREALLPGVGAFQASLSEGLSDFFAANINNDSGIGRGFRLDDAPVRDIDPAGYELVYPVDTAPSAHGTGLIIAGALWDLRKAFIAQYGATQGVALAEAIYAGVVLRAPNIPGAYLAAQIADDDDGDLGNGTPHGCALQAAFGKHGLAEATFETTRVGTPIVDGLTITVPVTTPTAVTCPVPQVTKVTITYQAGAGAPQTVELARSGATWTGAIPAQPPHTVLAYTVTATLDDQSTVIYPRNPADPRYQLFVGPADEIWCERFDGDPQWMQTGVWEVAAPVASSPSGDPATAFSGELVLGTQVTGGGRYTSNAVTSIETPPIDASGYNHVRLQFRRWLTVEDARYDQATVAVNGTTLWTNVDSVDGSRDHVDREWRFVDFDLTAQASAPLVLSWSLASDANRQLGGWTLDDICVVGYDKRDMPGDACTDDCVPEEDPGCCSTSTNPTSPLLLAFAVGLARRRRRR